MRDEDDRAFVVGQERLEPLERLDVQVVRRLVEQQERRALQQETREHHPHPPAARELAELAGEIGRSEAETAQDRVRFGLEPIAAERLEAMLQITVPRRQHVALRARRRGESRGDLLHLALDLPYVGESGEHRGENRPLRARRGLLGQIANGRLARPHDASLVRLLDAGQQPAEGRLAGAVGADQPDALAIGNPPRQADEDRLACVALGNGLGLDHRVTGTPRPKERLPLIPCSGSSREGP